MRVGALRRFCFLVRRDALFGAIILTVLDILHAQMQVCLILLKGFYLCPGVQKCFVGAQLSVRCSCIMFPRGTCYGSLGAKRKRQEKEMAPCWGQAGVGGDVHW